MRLEVRKMSRRRLRPMRHPPGTKYCCFCGLSEENEVEFGKLWIHNGIVTHYFCLLLSSNMEQNGNDDQGILGFMPADIQKELRRGKRLSCTYCRRAGATLGCCNTRCKRVFHLPCGLRAGSLHQFFGEFRSYCITHRMNQEIDEHIKEEAAAAGAITCYICYEEVNPQNNIRTLWAPCCRKNAWFHRKCVQRLALSAGYFFKCPLCNNKQEFQQAMLEHGIFIPNQDASWELVPNAYQELLHRHSRCDAVECLCPKGRSHTGVNAKWELVLCRLCGSQGIHKACGHLKLATSVWECSECTGMLRRNNETTPRRTRQSKDMRNEVYDDENSSSSDISVGRNPSPLPITERPDSSPPVISPIKLRPGPRSFKLQQAVKNAKSAVLRETDTSNTSMSVEADIPVPGNSTIDKNLPHNEKTNGKESQQEQNSPAKTSLLSFTESTSMETPTNTSEESKPLIKTAKPNSIDPRRRDAEIILIDSDDEVEIIIVKPKQNVLTTKDGTEIQIHSLSQVTSEPQKAEGDVKVSGYTHFELDKSSPCRNKDSCVNNIQIQSDELSLPNTRSPNTAQTVIPKIQTPNVSHTTAVINSGMGVAVEKSFINNNSSDLTTMNEAKTQNSVMNLRITNVSSIRPEDFADTVQDPNSISKSNSPNNICNTAAQSVLSRGGDQQLQIIQETDPLTNTSQLRTTAFQLSVAAIKDLTAKRKNEEYAEKNSCNLLNNEVMESRKKPRTCEANNSDSIQKNTNMSWNINLNKMNGAIPILASSIPITCSSDGNRFVQSITKLQVKPKESLSSIDGRVRTMYSMDIHKGDGFLNYPPATSMPSSFQDKTKNTTNHVTSPINEPFTIGLGNNSAHIPKVTRTYSSFKHQPANQHSPKNIGGSNTNIHGTGQSNQQFVNNGLQNLGEISFKNLKPQTQTQQIGNSSKNAASIPQTIHQSHENVNREMQRYNEGGRTSDVLFLDGMRRNCTEMPAGNNGNQPNVINTLTTSNSITQVVNGIPIHSGCDGDAGSSPAAPAGLAHQASSRDPVHPSTEPVGFNNEDAASDAGEISCYNSSISACISVDSSIAQHPRSPKNTRKYCDKPRLIPENVPLRNLKFRVSDPKIIQIIVHDNFTLNISVDVSNQEHESNTRDSEGLRSPIKKEQPPILFKQQLYSSSKFSSSGNYQHINSDNADSLPGIQDCSEITHFHNQKELSSLTRSLHNPLESELRFEDGDLSSSANRNIKILVFKTKYNIHNKISNIYMKKASLGDNGSYCGVERINSMKEISGMKRPLISACFEGKNENTLRIDHKENLPKEKMVRSAFSHSNWKSNNLSEIDNNIIFDDKRKRFSENSRKNSLKIVEYKNRSRSMSCIDFCSKTYDSFNHKDENIRSIGLNQVSKCLFKSFDDSSELNLSVDCYNNFKKIIDHRSSEVNCNIENLGLANAQDLFRSNRSRIPQLSAKNASNKVLADFNEVKTNQCLDTTNSSESKVQTVNTNHMTNTFCAVLNSGNINNDVSSEKPTSAIFKDQISSIIDKNTSGRCESDNCIKVKIDLHKIPNFVNDNPELYDKSTSAKRKRIARDGSSKILPNLVVTRNFDNLGSDNCSCSSKTQTTESVQDGEDSHKKKRLKYNSELFDQDLNR